VDEVVTTPADHAVTAVTLRDGVTESGVPVRVVLRPVGDATSSTNWSNWPATNCRCRS
jgi:hypothetical protein